MAHVTWVVLYPALSEQGRFVRSNNYEVFDSEKCALANGIYLRVSNRFKCTICTNDNELIVPKQREFIREYQVDDFFAAHDDSVREERSPEKVRFVHVDLKARIH